MKDVNTITIEDDPDSGTVSIYIAYDHDGHWHDIRLPYGAIALLQEMLTDTLAEVEP